MYTSSRHDILISTHSALNSRSCHGRSEQNGYSAICLFIQHGKFSINVQWVELNVFWNRPVCDAYWPNEKADRAGTTGRKRRAQGTEQSRHLLAHTDTTLRTGSSVLSHRCLTCFAMVLALRVGHTFQAKKDGESILSTGNSVLQGPETRKQVQPEKERVAVPLIIARDVGGGGKRGRR